MRIQIALRMPNNTVRYQIFDGVEALINARNVLQILWNKQLVAEYPPESYVSWQYAATPPPQPTSRAGQLLQQHPQG
jgi:hypothetical protein